MNINAKHKDNRNKYFMRICISWAVALPLCVGTCRAWISVCAKKTSHNDTARLESNTRGGK